MVQLERSDLARTYLEQLQNLNLDDAAKAQLHEQFGSGMLIRLSRQKELGPEGAQFVLSVLRPSSRAASVGGVVRMSEAGTGSEFHEQMWQMQPLVLRSDH